MRGTLDRTVLTAIVVLVGIGGWTVASSAGILQTPGQISLYALANVILLFDMVDLVVRIWVAGHFRAIGPGPSLDLGLEEISKAETARELRPYAIIGSVHDALDDIDRFTTTMEPFKDCVWLIDDCSSDDTLLRLQRGGWRCVAGTINRNKPGALYHLVTQLPPEIETVLVVDPDVRWNGDPVSQREILEQVISDLQRCGAAAVTPRFSAREHGWLEECQAFEYELACGLGRKSLGGMSTNAGVSIYRRSALTAALGNHTLSIYAEDLENSLLLLAAGERIYYDDRLRFVTEAKRSWKGLLSQRVGWSFGGAKVLMERLPLFLSIARRSPLGAYQYVIYLVINGFVLLPLKLAAVAILVMSLLNGIDQLFMTDWIPNREWDEPLLFGVWYLKTTIVLSLACFAALPRGERRRHAAILPLYPFYGLMQYIPMTIGVFNLLSLRCVGRRMFDDHYDPNPRLFGAPPPNTAEHRSS